MTQSIGSTRPSTTWRRGAEYRPVALGIADGDEVVFRVEGHRAVLVKTANFLDLAGTVAVPAAERSAAWDEVIRRTRTERAAARR